MKELKEVLKVLIGVILVGLGVISLLGGIIGIFLLFSKFTLLDLLVAFMALIIGFLFVWLSRFLVEREKRKAFLGGAMISLSLLLLLLGFITLLVEFSQKDSRILIPGEFITGTTFLSLGLFILLKELKKIPAPEEKILGVKEKNPFLVLILSILTLGIYHIWWFIETKKEMELGGVDLPGFGYLINPVTTIYFLYKYFEAFSTQIKKDSAPKFWTLLYITCWPVAVILIQTELNRVALEVY